MARIIGGRRTSYVFVEALHDLPANQNPQSHVLNWGAAPTSGTRHLIIGLAFITASGVSPNSVTVGGDAATQVVVSAPAGSPTIGQGIWIVEKPTGTSGTIEFGVPSSDIDGGMIAVWAAYNLRSATAVDTAAAVASGAGVSDVSVDTLAGGAVFAVAAINNTISRSVDWVGVAEDAGNETVNSQQWAASALDVVAATPRTVQASWLAGADPFRPGVVAASFR